MLQNFIICVNAVIPSAIYLIIGITLKVTGVIKDEEVKKFTHVVFVTLYPFIMFDNLYGKNIADNMDVKLGLYAVGFTVLQFAASWIFVCAIEKSNYERGAMIQALYRSNYVLMGFPIAVNLFGKGNITAVAIIMMLVVPFYNITAVIVFETFRGGKVNFGQMLKRILTNPIIDGGIAAFIVMILGINLPAPIVNTIGTLSDATAPIAMILLGAALNLNGYDFAGSSAEFKWIQQRQVAHRGMYHRKAGGVPGIRYRRSSFSGYKECAAYRRDPYGRGPGRTRVLCDGELDGRQRKACGRARSYHYHNILFYHSDIPVHT